MMNRIISAIFIASPLIVLTYLPYPQLLPRTIALTCLAIVALAYEFFHAKKIQITWTHASWLLLMAWLTATAAAGHELLHGMFDSLERETGIFFFLCVGALYLPLKRTWKSEPEFMEHTIAYTLIAMSSIGILQKIIPGFLQTFSAGRVGGTLGNAIFYASYLTLTICLVAMFWTGHKEKKYLLAAGLGVVALLLAQATGPLVGMIAGCITILLAYRASNYPRQAAFAGAGIIVLSLLVGIFVFPKTLQKMPTLQSRLVNWDIAWNNAAAHPILGTGWESYAAVAAAHFDTRLIHFGGSETYPDKPHNAYLELLSASGVVGLALYLCFIVCLSAALLQLHKSNKLSRAEFALGLGFIATYLVQNFSAFETHGTIIPLVIFSAWIGARETKYVAELQPKIIFAISTVAISTLSAYGIIFRVPEFFALKNNNDSTLLQSLQSPYAETYLSALQTVSVASLEEKFTPKNAWEDFVLAKNEARIALKNRAEIPLAVRRTARAISTNPGRQELFTIQGQLQLTQNNTAHAIAAFTQGVAIDPTIPEPHFYLAVAELVANNIDAGAQELETAMAAGLQQAPHDPLIFAAQKLQAAGKTHTLEQLEMTVAPN